MIERVKDRFGLETKKLIGDTAYGTAEFLAWMVNEANIEPHVPVWDKGEGKDGRLGRSDFTYNEEGDSYTCPAAKKNSYEHDAITRSQGRSRKTALSTIERQRLIAHPAR